MSSPFRGEVGCLAAGDWNRDGAIDALVVDNTAHAITVLNGDAARRLTAGQVFAGTTGDEVWYPKAGDVDGDGDLDVAYVNTYGGAGVIAVTNNRLVD